jgi:hypothetical protein
MATEGVAAAVVLINGVLAVLTELQKGNEPILSDDEVEGLVNDQKTSKENALEVLRKIIERENQ